MTTIDLVLPFPPKALEPNYRPRHWSEKSRAVKAYRRACWVIGLEARLDEKAAVFPLPPPVVAEITFIVKNLRRDADNCLASFKSGIDGLVDAKILVGDDSRRFDPGRPIVLQGEREEVRITLRGAE